MSTELKIYADTSFLTCIYLTQRESMKALAFMQTSPEPLPFTPLHRHELRNAIRRAVFRHEIDKTRRDQAFADVESDLAEGILAHVPIPWTDAFRESEQIGATQTETIGVRGIDLLHAGVARALGARKFLTFDARQGALAKFAGFQVPF